MADEAPLFAREAVRFGAGGRTLLGPLEAIYGIAMGVVTAGENGPALCQAR
ncbi:hypothetical protein [Ancylobacter sp.]|uniref:hypothetical protein n=1 Tax=Ancylobacter sp. TaxID=1872567 RepID=UPI003C79A29E